MTYQTISRTIAAYIVAGLLSATVSVSATAAEQGLSFAVSGVVAEVKVKPGDAVAKGAVLAVLDTTKIAARKRAADARLATAKVVHDLAKLRFSQLQELYDALSASAEQVDKAKITFVNARADLADAKAKAAVCAWNLGRATLKAPTAGTVSKVPGYAGQVITKDIPQPVVVINAP